MAAITTKNRDVISLGWCYNRPFIGSVITVVPDWYNRLIKTRYALIDINQSNIGHTIGNTVMSLDIIKTSKEVDLKFTETAGGYWNETSVNQDLDSKFWDDLVPDEAEADTVHGELMRCAAYIYRDMYQNDGFNLIEDEDNGYSCEHCGYYDQDEDDRGNHVDVCSDMFVLADGCKDMFKFLNKWMPQYHEDVEAAKKAVLEHEYSVSIAFDRLCDRVIHTILMTENQPMPVKQQA